MSGNPISSPTVKNIFRNGRPPTKEEYTQMWIDMINQLEQLKDPLDDCQPGKEEE